MIINFFYKMKKRSTLELYIRKLIKPQRVISIIRHYKYNRLFADKSATIGFDTSIISTCIQDFVCIGDCCKIRNSKIGKHTYIGAGSSIENSTIGSFCSISHNVTIGLSTHPSRFVSTHPAFYSNTKGFKTFSDKNYYNEYGTIKIGNDVLIGKNATVLYGVTIGDGVIITNHSVVTKNIPPYAIVGGVPAQIIKYRFDEETINQLLKCKWWNWDESVLQKKFRLFHDIDNFLNSNL